MQNDKIMKKQYWNEYADLWFGTTALPQAAEGFASDQIRKYGFALKGKECLIG